MEFVDLDGPFGGEGRGVDLAGALDDGTVAAIRAELARRRVLLFRDQRLDAAAQLAFGRRFGELEQVRTAPEERGRPQEYMYVANRTVDGMKGVLPDGPIPFHVDQCYYENPCAISILHAIEVPAAGGNTLFADAARAYRDLPEATRARLAGRTALHLFEYGRPPDVPPGAFRPDAPRFVHPVVVRHEETGEPVLYVNRQMTVRIEGLPPEEEAELRAGLLDELERAGTVLEHVWRPGDVLVWDNRAVQHARTAFDPAERRVLRRVTVRGRRPVAFAVTAR